MTTDSGDSLYVIARTLTKRPTLQHAVLVTDPALTRCGLALLDWPWRHYQREAIPYLLCRRCRPDVEW